MAQDIEMTRSRDLRIDETGDFSMVSGRNNINQQHANAIYRGVERTDLDLLNIDTSEELKMAIEEEFDGLAYVNEHSVSVIQDPPKTLIVTVETDSTANPIQREVNI